MFTQRRSKNPANETIFTETSDPAEPVPQMGDSLSFAIVPPTYEGRRGAIRYAVPASAHYLVDSSNAYTSSLLDGLLVVEERTLEE